MRKKVFGRQLSRARSSRKALFRSLIRALVLQGTISTTKAKAKSIQGEVDKLITTVKKDSVTAKRRVFAWVGNDKEVVEKLFQSILPAVEKRTSGFTRIINLPRRKGDLAQVVRLEFVDKPVKVEVKPKKVDSEKKPASKKSGGKLQAKSK